MIDEVQVLLGPMSIGFNDGAPKKSREREPGHAHVASAQRCIVPSNRGSRRGRIVLKIVPGQGITVIPLVVVRQLSPKPVFQEDLLEPFRSANFCGRSLSCAAAVDSKRGESRYSYPMGVLGLVPFLQKAW